jgi:cell wall assembly regulator SMI1/predicted DNA-binding WGR domain protein
MKKISAADRKKLKNLQSRMTEQEAKFSAAIDKYNGIVEAAYLELMIASQEYYQQVNGVEQFIDGNWWAMAEVVNDVDEGWEESKQGIAHQKWMDAWQWDDISSGSFKAERPVKVVPPDPPLSVIIAGLPLDPSEVREVEMKVEAPVVEPEKPSTDLTNQIRSSTILKDWKRIADWAAANVPTGSFRLAAGVSQEQIDAAEAILGFALPDDVRESYRAHDGSDDSDFPYIGALSPLEVVARDFAQRRSWPEDGWGTPDEIEGPIRPVWWDTSRVQVTDDSSGSGLTIDLDPAQGGTPGQVIHFDHERGPIQVLAASWGELLRIIADDAEAGNYSYKDGSPWQRQKLEAETPAKRYFEFKEGASSKFWEVVHEGNAMTTRYGKIGTNGQSTTKSYDSPEKAVAETAKIVAKKIKEGYVEKKL